MRGITALAVLALVGPAFAQGARMGEHPRERGPDARRGAGIEQKLEQILHRLERLEQRVEDRDRDRDRSEADRDREYKTRVENLFDFLRDFDGGRRDSDRRDRDHVRRHDRDERSPRRGPARRDGSRRGPRGDMRPGHDRPGPDAAPIAHFRRLMQAAQKGDPRARKMLEHMYMVIGKELGKFKKEAHIKKGQYKVEVKTAKAKMLAPGTLVVVSKHGDVASKRRAAAVKLMKVDEKKVRSAATQFRLEQQKLEEMKRAARVAELRLQAIKLQKEIEMLKRALEK